MIISKYLQKLFFLLMMGGALCTLQACGDDEKDEPVQKPNEEEIVKPDDGKEEEKPSDKPSDTMEAVDLGLPSGTLWATCNVGASSPEEYGGYYAWGEIEEKIDYKWNTYKWCDGGMHNMTKYCTNSFKNPDGIDDKTVLDPKDDVAHIEWGEGWRMPTKVEVGELYENCVWESASYNKIFGVLITGRNGNSIFLPAAGYRSNFEQRLGDVYYWTSTLDESTDCNSAYRLYYNSDWGCSSYWRCYGFPVRPVCD